MELLHNGLENSSAPVDTHWVVVVVVVVVVVFALCLLCVNPLASQKCLLNVWSLWPMFEQHQSFLIVLPQS